MEIKNKLVYILLFLASLVSFPPLIVLGRVYPFWKYGLKPMLEFKVPTYSFSKYFLPIFKWAALTLDQFANACAGALLNDLLLKKDVRFGYARNAYKYGKPYDTISEVTGINEERGCLNKFGLWFTKALGVVLNDNHSVLAINRDRSYPAHTKKK